MRTSILVTVPVTGKLFARHLLSPVISGASSRLRSTPGSRRVHSMAGTVEQDFFLDEFAQKQFNDSDPKYSGTRVHFDTAKFVAQIQKLHDDGTPLVDGYAPFCKHIFVPNFTGAKLGALTIDENNKKFLQSGYSRRRPEELPVLSRWFPLQDVQPVPEAQYLDCILYSREQLVKEYQAMPEKGKPEDLPKVPWGIISVKAQDEKHETPMQPITVMRNSLGAAEGGSGVPLDRKVYEASVSYWDKHAGIISGIEPSGE